MSDKQKEQAAIQAIDYIKDDSTIGVGTGSTVNFFIDALSHVKNRINAAVASSIETEKRLKALGIPVIEMNAADDISLYVDGADEVNHHKQMIKGGGGALTREKIIASAAKQFVCIVDDSKVVKKLGTFPIAIEVIPMARSFVARELVILGGSPEYREGFKTDNGNIILDLYQLNINEPMLVEETLNNITGIVCHGLFAKRTADVVLVGSDQLD